MSKRDMRAKKLLLAVLLAMSMQSYYAAPTWAAEAGQPTGQTETVDGKGQSGSTTTPATEAETSAPAEGEEAAAEGEDGANTDAAVPPVTYGVRAANAGNDDYGIMPLAAQTLDDGTVVGGVTFSGGNIDLGGVWDWENSTSGFYESNGKGELTGITKINNLDFIMQDFGDGPVIAIGDAAYTGAFSAVSLGGGNNLDGCFVISIGQNTAAVNDYATAVGGASTASGYHSTLIGSGAMAYADYSTALGSDAYIENTHTNSVAIGYASVTTAENQVSFGYKKGDLAHGTTKGGNLFRSLVNVKDLELNTSDDGTGGAITGLTGINGVSVAGTSAGTGLTVGGNATIGKTDTPFSSNGFSVDKNGAVTAASITDGTATLTGGAITGLSKVNDVHFVIDKDNENVAISNEEPWSTNSVIIGIGATATTDGTAIGNQAEANNTDSTAVGMMAKAYGDASVAVGVGGEATGNGAIAIGSGANAGHSESVAIGYDSTTSADNQVAFGKMTDTSTYRSLAGIKDITLTGAVNGVTLGVKGGTDADKGNVLVGGVDVTQMQTDVAGKASQTAFDTLNETVTNSTTGLVKQVTDLKAEDAKIRTDFATADATLQTTIDTKANADATGLSAENQGKWKTALGVDTLEGSVTTNTSNITALTGRVTTAETDIGSLKTAVDDSITGLEATNKIATDNAAAIKDADTGLSATYNKAAANETAIGTLTNKIGDETAGMVKDIADNTSAIGVIDAAYKTADAALAKKTSNFNADGDTLSGMTNISSTAATLGGVGFAASGVVTGVSTINTVKFDASGNISDAGTYNGVTIGSGGINGVTISKTGGSGSDVTVGGIDLTALADNSGGNASDITAVAGRVTAAEGDIDDLQGKTTKIDYADATGTTIDGVAIKSGVVTGVKSIDGIAIDSTNRDITNAGTYNGAAISTTKFNGVTLTTDGKVTATGITDGTATLTGGKLSGLTAGDITSAASTDAVTGGQVYTVKSDLETSISGKADTTTVTALDTRVGTAETDIGNLQTATADMATKTQVATDISAAKSTLETAYQAADTKLETDLTKAFGDADAALKTTLETAYQAADAQIKTDFASADAELKTDIDTKVAQDAYDSKMSALDSADTALQGRAAKLETKTANFNDAGNTLTGMANITSASATLGGVSFAAGGIVTGVESINTVKFDASGNISDAGTYNSVTIGTAGIGGTDTFNGISIKKEGTSVKVGDIDLTALAGGSSGNTDDISDLQAKTGGIERDTAGTTTKIEKNTSVTENGLATNKITVDDVILESGKLTVGSVTLTNGTLSGLTDATLNATSTEAVTGKQLHATNENVTSVTGRMTTAESDIGTLKTTVGDAANGLVKDTVELQSMVKDTTKGLEATNKIAVANAGDIVTLQTATTGMKYDNGTTTFAGGVAATVVTAGEFKISGTAFGFSSTGALTAASFNGVSIASDGGSGSDVVVGGINLSELNQKSGTTSDNTTGIEHSGGSGVDSYSTIEKNTKIAEAGIETNAITASGTVTANEFVENGKTLAERYAGKEAFEDVAALVGNDSTGLIKDAADLRKDTDGLKTATTGMSYDSGTTSTSFSGNVVVGNTTQKTHTQITDNAIIFGEGAEKQVTVDASGIHVGAKAMNGISTFADAGGTHIDHTSLVTGTVTAANLNVNGTAISGNAKDGLSVGGVNIKTLDSKLTALQTTVDGIQSGGSGTSTDTEGIKRDTTGTATTTIEGATSFTADGMETSNLTVTDKLTAATAAIGGVDFAASGVVSGISSINGVAISGSVDTGLTIGGVTLHGGLVNNVDISWLDQRVGYLEQNGGGSGGTGGGGGLNTSGISKPNPNTTVIEGSTSITSSGVTTNNLEVQNELIIGKGDKDQTTINKDGIIVGKNNSQSFINGTDGFVSQKGLYIGVGSSGDLASAKFSIDSSSGKLTSNVGGHSFTNSGNGAEFSNSSGTTTIKGGELSTDKLWVGGNEVKVSGNGDVEKNDAIDNQLSNNKDGYDYTNSFTTSEVGGTTQSATKESDADNEKKDGRPPITLLPAGPASPPPKPAPAALIKQQCSKAALLPMKVVCR